MMRHNLEPRRRHNLVALRVGHFRCIAPFLMAFAAGPAVAEVTVQCRFETECYETEACERSALSVTLSAGASPGTAEMRSPAETITGTVGGTDAAALTWRAETESAAHLLSWGADGAARYSVHLLLGPELVSYHGRCEAGE